MFTSTFTFAPGPFDDEFHRLDQAVAAIARSIDGFLGEEAWEDSSKGLVANVYYWETREALQQLMDHPLHIEAKRRQAQWLRGYHVVIAEVQGTYGDGGIAHPLGGHHIRY